MQKAETRTRVVIAARAALRRTMHEAVTAAGMQVAADCGSTAELLAAVSKERPDVCVLDRELRGGGLAATAAITSPPRAPKVLVVGGRGSPAERRAIRLAGAAASLPGDIDVDGLTEAIAALTRKEQP
jgi:DNA-binding NarL/FixJ family response regulator